MAQSQSEVLEVLEKERKPLSLGEISNILESSPKNVSHTICKLVKHKSIKIIEIDRFEALKKYKCRRRMRLYYI